MVTSINEKLIEASADIAALAADCGIDWYQISDLSPGVHKNLPVISPKYKGKSLMWVEEKTTRSGASILRLSFHTKKHGGISRSWHSHLSKNEASLLPKPKLKDDEAEAKKRLSLFEAFKNAYRSAPKLSSFAYLKDKAIEEISQYFPLRLLTDYKVFGRGSKEPYLAFELKGAYGQYVGLQRIWANGTKKMTTSLEDGQYRGAHAIIGDIETSELVFVAEGFATAASIYLATGKAVVVALNAGNLDPVLSSLLSRYEDKKIIIAADNDISENGNTGLFKAFEAARNNRRKTAQIAIVCPPLIGDEKTDFNDIHQQLGLAGLRSLLLDQKAYLTPARSYVDFLFQVLPLAKRQELPSLIRRLTLATKAPHFMSTLDLSEKISLLLGARADQGLIYKNIKAVIVAAHYQAKKISGISDALIDKKLQFLTEPNALGHLVLSDSCIARLLDELSEGHLVVLKAPMGTGKTELAIKRAIDLVHRAAHILPRISVVDDAAERLSLDHYKKIDEVMAYYTDKLVSCINSMGAKRFIAPNGVSWFENLDLLCIDEATQVLAQLTQLGQGARKKANHTALLKALSSARGVLATDADANDFLISELRRMAPTRKIVLFEVEHPSVIKKPLRITYTDSTAKVREEFINSVLSGTRSLLATDNRKKAMELERLIIELRPETKILNIHREPSKEGLKKIRRFYENPSRECLDYDVLIYSPAITSGVSLTSKHFERHFGIFTGVIKVNDILQMLGRDRTAESWLLGISPRSLKDERLLVDADLEALGVEKTTYSELKFATDCYELDSRENLIVLTLNILKIKGHKLSLADDLAKKLDKKLLGLLKKVSEDLRHERLERILSQVDISDVEYSRLKRLWMPSQEEAAAMLAFEVRHELCAPLIEENIHFLEHRGLEKLELFETFLADEKVLRRLDEAERKALDPSLRQFAFEKKAVLVHMMNLLGLQIKNGEISGEFTHENCQKVLAYFFKEAPKMNVLFKGLIDSKRQPRCATSFVAKIFSLLGLNVGKRKSLGRMIRFIEKSSYIKLLSLQQERTSRGRGLLAPYQDLFESAA